MRLLGNLLWCLLGGLFSALSWALAGLLWCITIIGIPVGLQCFKFASLSLFPFGKEILYAGGAPSLLLNILWLVFSGLPLAIGDMGLPAVHHHRGDPFRAAVLQDRPSGAVPLRQSGRHGGVKPAYLSKSRSVRTSHAFFP